MAKDRNGSALEEGELQTEDRADEDFDSAPSRDRDRKSKRKAEDPDDGDSSDSGDDGSRSKNKKKNKERHSSRRRHRRRGRGARSGSDEGSSSSSDSYSESDTEESGSRSEKEESVSESEDSEEARRRRRKEKRRRRDKEYEKEKRRRRKEKERRRRREEEKEERRRKRKKKEKEEKKKEKEAGKKGAVTNSWGKYGIIRETDMWNKRPEFTAWLSEVKQVNLESLANWEEKQMFKEFMEDHNTATFPSKKYYDMDAYHRHKMEKEMKKGSKKVKETERTIFNDEEQRRMELLMEREKQKEQEVEALKRSMQSGMAQAMKEQARLREEMMYQYKLGNFEAAQAIQKRLDPDVAM